MQFQPKKLRIFLVIILLMLFRVPVVDGASKPEEPEGAVSPNLLAHDREELAILEARLRAAEAQLRGAEGYKNLQETQHVEAQRQRKIGATSPRSLQLAEVQAALADAWYQTHLANREEARLRLQQAKRRLDSPDSEEAPDLERLRAEFQENVKLRQTVRDALETQVQAAELLLESERASLDNYRRLVLSGRSPAMTGEQARFRVAEAESWLGTVKALRDEEKVRLDRAQRLLAAAAEEGELDSDLPESVANQSDRLEELRQEVKALHAESLMQRRFIQMLLNQVANP